MKIYGTQRELIRAVRSSHACPPVMCTIKRISVCTAIHILVGDNDHIEPDGPDLLTLLGTQVLRKSHPSVNGRAISKSCGSPMRILAAIEDPSVAGKILDCLGLPSRPPPVAPARRDRQDALPEF